jgi:hypothetical protein
VIQKGSLRVASITIFGLCLAWVAVVHATYFVTLDDDIAEHCVAPLRGTSAIYAAIAFLFFQYFFSAFGLFLGILLLPGWTHSPARVGLVAGLLVGLWANAEFLAIPYCGAYTSLPGAVLGSVLSGGENRGFWYYGPALVTNVVLWAIVGWSLCWLPGIRQWVRLAGKEKVAKTC